LLVQTETTIRELTGNSKSSIDDDRRVSKDLTRCKRIVDNKRPIKFVIEKDADQGISVELVPVREIKLVTRENPGRNARR